MFWMRHISDRLAAHLDGRLAPAEAERADLHLAQCARCRAEREQVQAGMALLDHLAVVEAPETIWREIEAAMQANAARRWPVTHRWRWALAATTTVVVVLVVAAAYWRFGTVRADRWDVIRIDGTPIVAARRISATGKVGPGEWIETDAQSRATIQVGTIGSVEVTSGTRLRVVAARSGEHRIALSHGEIRARILAPPKLFFVDTAAGTAVDLGCEYALRTDEEGSGLLQVTRGWVSFEWRGLESLVPAGASCRTWPRGGPGIPYFDDAPEALKGAIQTLGSAAVLRIGVFKNGDSALDTVLSASRVRDTLTLWHLLPRVEGPDRARVFDRIAVLAPLPAGVSREQAILLDPPTLKHWLEELAWTW